MSMNSCPKANRGVDEGSARSNRSRSAGGGAVRCSPGLAINCSLHEWLLAPNGAIERFEVLRNQVPSLQLTGVVINVPHQRLDVGDINASHGRFIPICNQVRDKPEMP